MIENETFRTYLQTKALTAAPDERQLMLYEGAIRFARMARAAIEEKDTQTARQAFVRTDEILTELHGLLRPEPDPELFDKFGSLYNFCMRKMLDANYTHTVEPIDDALTILQHLRETWVVLVDRYWKSRSPNVTPSDSPSSD